MGLIQHELEFVVELVLDRSWGVVLERVERVSDLGFLVETEISEIVLSVRVHVLPRRMHVCWLVLLSHVPHVSLASGPERPRPFT